MTKSTSSRSTPIPSSRSSTRWPTPRRRPVWATRRSSSGSSMRRWSATMAKVGGWRREVPTPELRCPTCAAELERFWAHCSNCGRRLEWRDTTKLTGAECYYCRWVVAASFSFCPWCGRDVTEPDSSPEPLKAPKGFSYHRRCRWGCGGGVMYPMRFCPWCGRPQKWHYWEFQNVCPHCSKGVNDWMDVCPWCGEDATGRDLDRKSTRLNSSHDQISYAVFCLKKKKVFDRLAVPLVVA